VIFRTVESLVEGRGETKMRTLRIVILLIALLVLTTQAARHVYVRYIEPRTSALDRFDDTDAKKVIQGATTLSEIVSEYEPARKRVDDLNKDLKRELSTKTRDEYYMHEQKWKEDYKQEYEREAELKKAIQEWENRSKEILELRVFWLFGLGFFVAGMVMLKKGKNWLGMAFLIPGIVEMIWWTSPSFRFGGSPLEFDRLLNNKLGFTIVTIALLLAAWHLSQRRDKKELQPSLGGDSSIRADAGLGTPQG
jgi:hypothetical protein